MNLELLLKCKEHQGKWAKKYQDRPVGPTGRIILDRSGGPVGSCVCTSRLKQHQSEPVLPSRLIEDPTGRADRSEKPPTVASVKCRPVGRTGRKSRQILQSPRKIGDRSTEPVEFCAKSNSRLCCLATGRADRSDPVDARIWVHGLAVLLGFYIY